MPFLKKNEFLFKKVSSLKGVGHKLSKYLKNKKVEKIHDLLLDFPYSQTDRSDLIKINNLEPGKTQTIKAKVIKYNFPRIRNLPNKIICEDETGRIELSYFNSREGYLKNILKIGSIVIISGKTSLYKKKIQMINPPYVTTEDNIDYVQKIIPKYSLSDGLTEKSYRKIIEQVLLSLDDIHEWYEKKILKKLGFSSWKESILKLHEDYNLVNSNSNYYKRLAFDEIMSNLIVLSENRKKIKVKKNEMKKFNKEISNKIINNLSYNLTENQKRIIDEINIDLESEKRMFRLLQGDVGSGKTIISLISASNVIESGFQCAFMAPTEVLASQHFELINNLFKGLNIKTVFLTGKTTQKEKNHILKGLKEGKINFIVGTHSLFQNKINFFKLGLIIIDEQHKFGVNQRMRLAKKGGSDCDVLLMSATPIPRTIMLALYGDMDISRLIEKPNIRKEILTFSKPEKKINELWPLLKRELKKNNQVFWVCPLIDDSKILDYSSVKNKYQIINKIFPNNVGIIHGSLDKEEKNKVIEKFKKKKINILVSTTVIEVGIDFPDANLIVIENANKFGLAQLHQLRGRVGRGKKQGICILLFKKDLSKNAIARIKILKSTNDGFLISEKDMRLRGFGDIIGFQQSGIKYFRIADPSKHEELFKFAEKYIKELEKKEIDFNRYNFLLKLFDKAQIININDDNN